MMTVCEMQAAQDRARRSTKGAQGISHQAREAIKAGAKLSKDVMTARTIAMGYRPRRVYCKAIGFLSVARAKRRL